MMGLRDKISRDRDRVFLNEKHYADAHTVLDKDGKEYQINMILRYHTIKEQAEMALLGTGIGEAKATVKTEDLPRKPSAGDVMVINGTRWYVVNTAELGVTNDTTGMYEINLSRSLQYL